MSHLQAFDLPARLVEISPDVNHSDRLHVKLVAPMLKDIRYICLSHCWGHRTFIQTQKSNLSQFVEAIPWHELPRTFQEAISLTFRLGISYIWIDSLCICQDDTADWRHEGSRMDSIFTGAYLTLAASRSASAEEGLFVDSFANTSRMLQWNGGRAKWDVHVRESFAHETFDSSSMPLLHRAWVFQERLLSVRVVHFTSTELLWECTEETTCECTKLCQHVPPRRRKGGLKPEESLLGEQTYWHELVQEYTTKQLSYEKDIFPALQGVARRMRTLAIKATMLGYGQALFVATSFGTPKTPDKRGVLTTGEHRAGHGHRSLERLPGRKYEGSGGTIVSPPLFLFPRCPLELMPSAN
jgi:hypothetical protein